MATDTQYQPRIDMIDALRGFALMGLFVVHACEYFELWWYHPPAHNTIHDWVFGLFAGKAFAMFALMFGVSFFIIMDRQAARGTDFSVRFLWRLAVLFAIGFLDAFFYAGEVLQVLALCGLVLVPLNRLSWKGLLPVAIACFLQPVLLWQYWTASRDIAANVQPGYFHYPALEVFAHGNWTQLFAVNLWIGPLTKWQFMFETGRMFQIVGLFLTGLMLGRAGFFHYPERFHLTRRLAFVIALAVAVCLHFARPAITAALPSDDAHFLAGIARDALIYDNWQAMAAMTMWVTGFIELYQWTLSQTLLRLLAPAGRMTLSLYVMQNIVGVSLYYACGLGWYATIGQPRALMFGIVFFAAQVALAHLWFRYFYYGPLEWVWRTATYLSLKVPFVRKPRAT